MSDATDSRVARIEESLLPLVAAEGRLGETQTLTERMRHYGVPGLSVAVIDSGAVAWARGYGVVDANTEERVTPSSLFQAGSISKAVAALGALRLVDRGAMHLDQDVTELLSSWRLPQNALTNGHPVTPRGLLAHDAGVSVHGFPGYAADAAVPTLRQVLDGVPPANTPPVCVDAVPGTRWRYSGGGYAVLQQLMIDLSGRSFPELMRESVFDRLGMSASTYEQPLPVRRQLQAASGHHSGGRPVRGRFHTYPEMAAAGLWTTPSDLARFAIGIQRAWAGIEGAVIGPALARDMLTLQARDYGLGLMLAGDGASALFHHGGVNEGFEADLMGFVQGGLGVAVMANASGSLGLIAELVDCIARESAWPDYRVRAQLVDLPSDDAILAAYVGRYGRSQEISLTIGVRDGRLWLELPGGEPLRVVASPAHEFFYVASWNRRLDFMRDDGTSVTTLVIGNKTELRRIE